MTRTARPGPSRAAARAGVVSLVGAGPGDPGLLTLRALERLRGADVIYHDALVSAGVLDLVRPEARLVEVGKRRGAARPPQDFIEWALIRDAKAGLAVVRLKGGDPFVFGRGGEEALALARSGVPFEIIPGISSGIAAPAYAGIPLTHRGISGSAAFVTAHDLSAGRAGGAVRRRLRHLAQGAETLVIFMAGAELARLRTTLLRAGLPAGTPAALLESATLPGESRRTGTLGDLERLGEGRSGGPVLVVVGRTVALSAEILGAAVGRSGRSEARAATPAPRGVEGRAG